DDAGARLRVDRFVPRPPRLRGRHDRRDRRLLHTLGRQPAGRHRNAHRHRRRHPRHRLGDRPRQPLPAVDDRHPRRRRHGGDLPGDHRHRAAGVDLHHRRPRQPGRLDGRGGRLGAPLGARGHRAAPRLPRRLPPPVLRRQEAPLPPARRERVAAGHLKEASLRLRGLRSLRSLRFPRWLLGGSLLALLGCASTAEGPLDRAALAEVGRAQGRDPAAVVLPYEPTPEMKAWVHEMVPPAITKDDDRLQHLLAALLDPKRLGLSYEAHYTGTAREVFASHRANYLAFTNIFVGLARELGVKIFFLDVDDIEKFEKEGDLVVISGHISTGYGSGRDVRILDFAAAPTVHYRAIRPISNRTAVALYYSTRGGELLRTGSQEEALKWLRTSVALDPELARAW